MMRKIVLFSFLLLTQFYSWGQVLEFDKLEMRYDQMQYKAVYRQSKRLMAKPEYDFSFLPRYYHALAKLQLAQQKNWLRRNPHAIDDAMETFEEIYSSHEGKNVMRAHRYELSILKGDLTSWMYQLTTEKNDKSKQLFQKLDLFTQQFLKDIPSAETMQEDQTTPDDSYISLDVEEKKELPTVPVTPPKTEATESFGLASQQRQNIIISSEELLGTPYKWAGNTPKGFDCSGFTCYIMDKEIGKQLDRTAGSQFKDAKKVKRKDVQPGDLVFFGTGAGISHVGIVYSTENESVQMIHSSTSIGISIVDIYTSSYWKKRIKGFGTYLSE